VSASPFHLRRTTAKGRIAIPASPAAAMLLLLAGLSSAGADTTSTLPAPIESCIRSNAEKVERAVPDLNQAVAFLVEDVCAAPIAEANRQMQRAAMQEVLKRQRKACADWRAKNTGSRADQHDEGADPCQMADLSNDADAVGSWTLFAPQRSDSAEAASLAATLLLDLRLARQKAGR